MTFPQPIPEGRWVRSPHGGVSTYSTILSCVGVYGPLTTQVTGGVTQSSLRSEGARLPGRKEVDMRATSILQNYLDDLGHAVMTERFEDYASRILLPLNILTSSANMTVSTVADLEDGFDEFCEMILSLGVTDLIRAVKVARFHGNDHVVGIYETRMLNGRRQVLPSFHSKMWIGTYDGIWKAIKIHNTTKDAHWPMLYTRLGIEQWPIEEY